MTVIPLYRDHLLAQAVVDAIHAIAIEDKETAIEVATLVSVGRVRVLATFGWTADDEPIPGTLAYRVELPSPEGWLPLVLVGWRDLALEWIDVLVEVEAVRRQIADGTWPGGPADAA